MPGGTPTSVQLASDCVLLVMTRQRKTEATYTHPNKTRVAPQLTQLYAGSHKPELDDPNDQLFWLCHKCGGIAHAIEFTCTDYCQ